MNLNDIVQKKLEFHYMDKEEDIIYLGYSIDNRFARCTGTSIFSFVKNNPKRSFSAEIITSGLSEDNITRFKKLAIQCKIDINIYIINIGFLESLNLDVSIKWPIAIYFRFLYPFILKDVKKVFYIDGDILCLNECEGLFKANMQNKSLAACRDLGSFTKKRCEELKIKQDSYFNSGMMIIDCEKWFKENIWEKFIYILENRKKPFKSPDQDILNILFNDNVLYLEHKYNFQLWATTITKAILANKEISLLHFGGHPKPWQKTWPMNKLYNEAIADLYANYEKDTPWRDVPLDVPQDYKDRRLYAKLLFKEGNKLAGIIQYMRYSKEKIIYKINGKA